MDDLLFGGWSSILRILIVGALAYLVLVVFLRVSGKRTLTKLNAFDLVVTVALGSTLATVLLNRNVPLADGAMAFSLLVGLQYAVTWLSVRVPWLRRIVTGEPALLLNRGDFMPVAMRKARITKDEVRAAVRSSGVLSMEEVEGVVLETDGSLSVIPRGSETGHTSLEGVKGYDRT